MSERKVKRDQEELREVSGMIWTRGAGVRMTSESDENKLCCYLSIQLWLLWCKSVPCALPEDKWLWGPNKVRQFGSSFLSEFLFSEHVPLHYPKSSRK